MELSHNAIEYLFVEVLLDGHGHVHLTRTDEIDDYTIAIERAENGSQETMRDVLPIRINVQDDYVFLDRHCCRLSDLSMPVKGR